MATSTFTQLLNSGEASLERGFLYEGFWPVDKTLSQFCVRDLPVTQHLLPFLVNGYVISLIV